MAHVNRTCASPGGNAYMATGTPVGQLGGGSSDPHAPWRCDVTFTRSKFGTYGSMSVGLYRNGLTGPTYDLIIPDSTVPQAKAGVGGFQFDALPAPREPGPTTVSVEHPSGEFSVALGLDPKDSQRVTQAALLRTARLIMRGEVMVPARVWPGYNI